LSDRAHLSIGEVLSLLRAEFPDITISKIRFLESQGLLDPERTPSGYRKFYEEDVERLRWILRQQREHFLPLKVIKGRLSEADPEGAELDDGSWPPDLADEEGAASAVDARAGDDADAEADQSARRHPAAAATLFGDTRDERPDQATQIPATTSTADVPSSGTAAPSVRAADPSATPTPAAAPSAAAKVATTTTAPLTTGGSAPASAAPVVSKTPASAPAASGSATRTSRAAGGRTARPALADTAADVNLTVEELAASCGLAVDRVRELERFGLLVSRDVGGTAYYGEEAQAVAVLAAGFAGHGVEARHLRMYKNSAERESGLFEQIVMPLIKQRNPQARVQAAAAIEELSRLGGELRETLLRRSLRDAL
jgi:DNA-binding transcriptional MerR regulator